MNEEEYEAQRAAIFERIEAEDTESNDLLKGVKAALKRQKVGEYMSALNRLESLRGARTGRAMDGAEFISGELAQNRSVWGQSENILWGAGEGTQIASDQGLGKTTLAQQVSLRRIGVFDTPLLGYPVAVQTEERLLYLAMDRPRQAARSIARMVLTEHMQTLRQRLAVWRGPLPIDPLVSPSAVLKWMYDEFGRDIGTVIVDSVKDVAPGLSKDDVGAGINSMCQELLANDIEVLALHHERKATNGTNRETRPLALDNIFGSTFITSGFGSVFGLQAKQGDDLVKMSHLKSASNMLPDMLLRFDFARGTVEATDEAATVLTALQKITGVFAREPGRGYKQEDVTTLSGCSKGTVSRLLRQMSDQGDVTKTNGLWHWTKKTTAAYPGEPPLTPPGLAGDA